MMKILLVMLVIGAMAHKDETVKLFQKMQQSHFGKHVLGTLQLEIKNSPDQVLPFLQQLQVEIQAALKEATSAASEATCAQELQSVNDVIVKAQARVAEDEEKLPLVQELLSNKHQQAEDKLNEKQRNLDRIAALTDARVTSKKAYDDRRSEIVSLIAALQQGKQLFSQSFIQELEHHEKNFMKRYPEHRGFNSLISVTLAMANDPALSQDKQLKQKVIEVIEDLVEELFDLQKQEMISEDAREAAYQKEKARYELANQNLAVRVSQFEADIANLDQKVLELNNDIALQKKLLKHKQAEKADWIRIQDNSGKCKVQANREEQLDIVNQAITLLSGGVSSAASVFLQKL